MASEPGLGDTDYSITAYPGICVADQDCWGNPRGQVHQWFYTSRYQLASDPDVRRVSVPIDLGSSRGSFTSAVSPLLVARLAHSTTLDNPEPWDFSKHPAADLVVINIGTNDHNEHNNVTASSYITALTKLVQGVHGKWPQAKVIVMVLPESLPSSSSFARPLGPSSLTIETQSLWLGFYQSGNTYLPRSPDGFVKEIYNMTQYFNSDAYLSNPVVFDGITNKTSNTGNKTAPFVHYFNTTGIMQHNDIGPGFHPTDVRRYQGRQPSAAVHSIYFWLGIHRHGTRVCYPYYFFARPILHSRSFALHRGGHRNASGRG